MVLMSIVNKIRDDTGLSVVAQWKCVAGLSAAAFAGMILAFSYGL
jgi:hypothetical protein